MNHPNPVKIHIYQGLKFALFPGGAERRGGNSANLRPASQENEGRAGRSSLGWWITGACNAE